MNYTNKLGSKVSHATYPTRERYHYDNKLGPDWKQYDTDQDAPWFGVWVNPKTWQILTFAEGDESQSVSPTLGVFKAELEKAAKFYGDPPPAMIVINHDGSTEHLYDQRPTVE